MTVTDLLKLITRYQSTANIVVGHGPDETGELSGEILHSGDDLILLLKPAPVESESAQEQPAESGDMNDRLLAADEAIGQCDNILELIEELPDRAEDFGDSIREKVESMRAWIDENDHVTEAQKESLDNMERGILKWIR